MPSTRPRDILICPLCGSRSTRSVRLVWASETWSTRVVIGGSEFAEPQSDGLPFRSRHLAQSALLAETCSLLADVLTPPTPPSLTDTRRNVMRRLRAQRRNGDIDDDSCFTRRFGLLVVARNRMRQLADAEYQRRLRVYELAQANWPRNMVCMQCGHVYDPYIDDQLLEEGHKLFLDGRRRTGSRSVDILLTDFEERVTNIERRAQEAEMPRSDFALRLGAALPGDKIGRAVRMGELSPVVLVRLHLIANRVTVASVEAGVRRVLATVAALRAAAARARMTPHQQEEASSLLHRAASHADSSLAELRDVMARVGAVQLLHPDGEVFVVAGTMLQDVIRILPAGAAYQDLIGAHTPLTVSIH